MRLERLGHHHQAGGVLVEAVDDAAARHAGQLGGMVQQGVEQGAVGMPGGRMHDQPRRLVQHQDLLVFVDDVQLDILRLVLDLRVALGLQLQHGTTVDGVARTQHGTVDGQPAILDPASQARARMIGKDLGGDLVKTLSAQFGRHLGTQLNDFGHGGHRGGPCGFGFSHRLVVKYGEFPPEDSGAPIISGRPPSRTRPQGTQAPCK
ncbi:hypothetical protein D3C81_1646930 [compost metagenome]